MAPKGVGPGRVLRCKSHIRHAIGQGDAVRKIVVVGKRPPPIDTPLTAPSVLCAGHRAPPLQARSTEPRGKGQMEHLCTCWQVIGRWQGPGLRFDSSASPSFVVGRNRNSADRGLEPQRFLYETLATMVHSAPMNVHRESDRCSACREPVTNGLSKELASSWVVFVAACQLLLGCPRQTTGRIRGLGQRCRKIVFIAHPPKPLAPSIVQPLR